MLHPPPFPISIDDLTTDTLSSALRRPVIGFLATRIGAERSGSGDIYLVEIEYRSTVGYLPGPDRVVAKFAARDRASLAVADMFGTPERELRCYEQLLPSTPIDAPAFHAAWYDRDTGHFLLVLEAIEADEPSDQIDGLDVERARLVVAELAKLHARWWGDPRLHAVPWLPASGAEVRLTNLTTLATVGWGSLCDLLGDELTASERAIGHELPARIHEMLTSTARLTPTLLHGDLRTSNMLFDRDRSRVSLIDWQAASAGPAGFDLAAFLTQCLTVEDRRANEPELLAFYRERLAAAGVLAAGRSGHGVDVTAGYGPSILIGLAAACALPFVGDPGEPRVARLASTMVRRAIEALRDNDQLWEAEP